MSSVIFLKSLLWKKKLMVGFLSLWMFLHLEGSHRKSRFFQICVEKLYSDIFDGGGFKWSVLIFPKGNKTDGHLSIYLDVADAATLPDGWNRHAHFNISVIS